MREVESFVAQDAAGQDGGSSSAPDDDPARLFDEMTSCIDNGKDHSQVLEKMQSIIRQDKDKDPSWLFDKIMGTIDRVSRETTSKLQTDAGRASVRVCARCGTNDAASDSKLMRCQRCKVVSYCSQECQRADWKQHKKLCNKP